MFLFLKNTKKVDIMFQKSIQSIYYSRGSEFCTVSVLHLTEPNRTAAFFTVINFLKSVYRTIPRSVKFREARRVPHQKIKAFWHFLMSANRTVLFWAVFLFYFKSASRTAQKKVNFWFMSYKNGKRIVLVTVRFAFFW